MNHLIRRDPMDDFFRGFFVRPMDYSTGGDTPAIKMDVKEQKDAYVVHADIPGAKKEDIHVLVEGNTVTLSAEIKHEKEVKDGEHVLRSERYFGQVSRVFSLGHDIDDSKANAKLNDGVLELTLPKKLGASGKRLEIR